MDAVRLVVPVECAGCGRWDVTLCEDCRALLRTAPQLTTIELAGAPVWTVGTYTGALRALVLAWKNRVRLDLGPEVSAATDVWVRRWAADSRAEPALARCRREPEVLVVPAPSGWRRRASRRLVVAELADAVGHALAGVLAATRPDRDDRADALVGVRVADVLRRRGGASHQAGRGARSRSANRRGTVRALCDLTGSVVVLVDDVVTTGATLEACAAELRARGATVIAGLTLAAAPAPSAAPRVPGGRVHPVRPTP